MVSLEEFRQMEVDETTAYNLYKEETNKAKKRKLYKAFQAIQDANETKRFLVFVK